MFIKNTLKMEGEYSRRYDDQFMTESENRNTLRDLIGFRTAGKFEEEGVNVQGIQTS